MAAVKTAKKSRKKSSKEPEKVLTFSERMAVPEGLDVLSYDKVVVAFSGGKDSIACFLRMLELGVPKERIELWHHDIDGGKDESTFMDWEITHSYCQTFADHFGVPIYFSWKQGGFKREMLRKDSLTAPIQFEVPNDGGKALVTVGGITGKLSTRQMFPQLSPDLMVRWCSAYLKIDVCSAAIRNQERFRGLRTLVVSGERGEESDARKGYAEIEPDRADLRDGKEYQRYVDRYRAVKNFKEQDVWDIIQRWGIRVHPAYYLGFGRVSCKFCIYGNENQFATANAVSPLQAQELIMYENTFGKTMKRNISLAELIAKGTPYAALTDELGALATSYEYKLPIHMNEGEWYLPAGAFGESCGSM